MNRISTVGLLALMVASCGGGGGSADVQTPPPPPPQPDPVKAATATINNNAMCAQTLLGDYYWEIGDATGMKVSGQVGTTYAANSSIPIDSASKWLYASSVLQQRAGGVPDPVNDVPYLNFTSGYSNFGNIPICGGLAPTVGNCPPYTAQNVQNPASVGRFAYDSGHMQQHASAVMGLGADANSDLAARLTNLIGISGFSYNVPQLAAGVVTTPSVYAQFLRLILNNQLAMKAALGSNKVCAQSAVACSLTAPNNLPPGSPNAAFYTPTGMPEAWNYSLGHWVEDDPNVGDHAFSSPGGGGFYPWIDKSKTLYGILARYRKDNGGTESGSGYHSAQCARLARQAYITGFEVTTPNPVPGL